MHGLICLIKLIYYIIMYSQRTFLVDKELKRCLAQIRINSPYYLVLLALLPIFSSNHSLRIVFDMVCGVILFLSKGTQHFWSCLDMIAHISYLYAIFDVDDLGHMQ